MGAHLARQLAASYHQPGHHAKILPASPSAEWCTPAEGTSRCSTVVVAAVASGLSMMQSPCAGYRADHARRQSISAVTLLACNCHLLLLGCAWAAARRRRRRRSRRAVAAASQEPAARAGSPLLQLRTHPERRSGAAHLLPPKTAGGRLHLPCSSWGWLKSCGGAQAAMAVVTRTAGSRSCRQPVGSVAAACLEACGCLKWLGARSGNNRMTGEHSPATLCPPPQHGLA